MTQHALFFTARSRRLGDRVYVVLAGELDLVSVPLLERELQRAGRHQGCTILLDISALSFCDLTGQRALRVAVNAGGLLVGVPPRCLERLYELTGECDMLLQGAEPQAREADATQRDAQAGYAAGAEAWA